MILSPYTLFKGTVSSFVYNTWKNIFERIIKTDFKINNYIFWRKFDFFPPKIKNNISRFHIGFKKYEAECELFATRISMNRIYCVKWCGTDFKVNL